MANKYVANTTIYENGRVYQKGDVINVSDERIQELLKMTVRAGEPMVVAENEYEGEIRETADASAMETTSATGTDAVVENPEPSSTKTDYSTDTVVYEEPAPTPAPTNEEDSTAKKSSENTNEGGETATSEPTEESKEEPQASISESENQVSTQSEQKAEASETSSSEYPKHLGGGWYELEDGTKVQGKDEAYQAVAEKKEKQ